MAKILVIDDDTMVRDTLRAALEGAGHRVAEASSGVQGVEQFKEHTPDLVITNMIMPGKGGSEAIQEMARLRPEIKLIAITSSDPQHHWYLRLAKDLGATRTFTKPFDVNVVGAAVEELLAE